MMRRVLLALLFVSAAWTTLPELFRLAAEALALRELTVEERRARIIPGDYAEMTRLHRSIPDGEEIALVLRRGSQINPAIFFNYYSYPQRTRIFADLGAYRMAKDQPRRIILTDSAAREQFREMTYEAVRADEIGKTYVVTDLHPAQAAVTSGLIPLVASAEGVPPDVFTTEAVIENPSGQRVEVTLQLLPSKRTATLALEPKQRMTWNDFVYEVFDAKDQGWLELRSTAPVRAAFWFVDRGRREASPLPMPQPEREATLRAPPRSKLWMINPGDAANAIDINGVPRIVPPRDWAWIPAGGVVKLHSEQPFVAYLSHRHANGGSRLSWPD